MIRVANPNSRFQSEPKFFNTFEVQAWAVSITPVLESNGAAVNWQETVFEM